MLYSQSIGFDATLRPPMDDELDFSSRNKKEEAHPLSLVEPADLVKYGLIPEFVGRLPVLASVNNLSVNDLVRVLTEPKNSLLKQYEGLFKLSQVRLQTNWRLRMCKAEWTIDRWNYDLVKPRCNG